MADSAIAATMLSPRGASSALEALARIPATVGQVMTTKVTTLSPEAPVLDAVQLFGQCGFRHVLVVDAEQRLVGVLSDRDALRSMARGNAADVTTVSTIMTRDSITATPDMPLMHAIDLLTFHRIHCLPIIAKDGRVGGVVTTSDLLGAFHEFLDRVRLLIPD